MDFINQRYRYPVILLREIVIVDFKLKYQGSFLGYVWSLLRPLFIFAILYVVFVKFVGVGDEIPHFGVYLLVGIVLWNYFGDVTTQSITSIVGKGDLLRKVNFPRYIIIIAGSFSALINLFLSSIIIVLFMIFTGAEVSIGALYVPLLTLELFVFSIGIAFFLSAAYVKYRDLNYIWEVVVQAGFYATPILYPLTLVSDKSQLAAKVIMLNPVAQLTQDFRQVLVSPHTTTVGELFGNEYARFIPIAIVCIVAVSGFYYFKYNAAYFAERV